MKRRRPAFRLASAIVAKILGVLPGCGSTTGQGPPPGAITATIATELGPSIPLAFCTSPETLPNGHRVSSNAAHCLDPAVPFDPGNRRPFLALSVRLATSDTPSDLPGLHVALAAIASDAPEPGAALQRTSIQSAALAAGLELVPTTRAGQVGWVAYLPDTATTAMADRAAALLIALAQEPSFGAGLVTAWAERFQHQRPIETADGIAAAWAASLAAGHARRIAGPMDTRSLAIVNREDLARLHRRLFSTNIIEMRSSGIALPDSARARFTSFAAPTTINTSNSNHCPTPNGRIFAFRTPGPERAFAALPATGIPLPHLAATIDILALANTSARLAPPRLFVIDDRPFVVIDPADAPSIAAMLTRNAERLADLLPADTPDWPASFIAIFQTAHDAVTILTHTQSSPPDETIPTDSLRCPFRR